MDNAILQKYISSNCIIFAYLLRYIRNRLLFSLSKRKGQVVLSRLALQDEESPGNTEQHTS